MSCRASARRTRSRSVLLATAVVAVSAILASGCGGDSTQPGTRESSATQPAPADSPAPAGSDSDAEPSAGPETAPAAADTTEQVAAPIAVSGDVPDLELIDVATGDGVQLRSLLPADTPVLFWFWAPH